MPKNMEQTDHCTCTEFSADGKECGNTIPNYGHPRVTAVQTGKAVVWCWDCAMKFKDKYGKR